MRIALAQINTTIGDYAGNLAHMKSALERARAGGADLVVFPELALCGYPPLDLLQRSSFLAGHERAREELAASAHGVAVVSGALLPAPGAHPPLQSSAQVFADGALAFAQAKTLLPTYDVFDEARYFRPAAERRVWTHRGRRIGFAICEDVWSGEYWGAKRPYPIDPVAELVAAGAELLVVVSASPWEQRKIQLREAMMCDAARRHRVPFVFVNLVGGNDELVFDGSSAQIDASGRVVQRLASFSEDFALVEPFEPGRPEAPPLPDDVELLERALVLGVRDYLHKLGLRSAVIGLSGGIDSAVTAHIAERALGADQVLGVMMPGPYSSEHSLTDAQTLIERLGIDGRCVRIDSIYKAFLSEYAGLLGRAGSYGLTQENLQARVRGTLLMSVSNHEGRIVLATGNKSELSVGYTTLYGDLVGGLAVIGDVLKRDVYALARHANRDGERIPFSTLQKPPSAELAPDQFDTDSLPPYDVLDAILEQAIEQGTPPEEIVPPPGANAETVRWVLAQIDRNEYKRRQAPVVLRTSQKAFGLGRRLPIVHRSGWGV